MNRLFRKYPQQIPMIAIEAINLHNPYVKAPQPVPVGATVIVNGRRPSKKGGLFAWVTYQGMSGFCKWSSLGEIPEPSESETPV